MSVFGIFGICAISTVLAQGEIFPDPSQACVAWKTNKRMFLVSHQSAVGRSCQAILSRAPEGPNLVRIQLEVPIRSFNSGEKERDDEVFKILSGSVQPTLRLETDPISPTELERASAGKTGSIRAKLTLGGKPYMITLPFQVLGNGNEARVVGQIDTTFKAFDIEPPTVAMGIVAKVDNLLELHFSLPLRMLKQ